MMLIKEIAVYVNILNSRIKKCFFDDLQNNGINVTPEQYLVLDILWENQPLSQQKIADMIQKDKNSVTKIIDSLEKKNLVSRIVDKNDRRINIIELTEEGRNLEKIATDVAIKFMNDVVQGIDKQDLDSYMKVMRQMKNNLERE
ncbi:MAG: MarR family transcriptional regulator [Bacteroidales bacterium]|jgi:DNA-binding MarR family transcriptional regulator|nr:MarR family transcriptional regulator [Bacteroidales bacterium]MBO7529629.1 MarR family transcriptional regulator [Bacteroidales bacterium]MBQ3845016.1 MarR family transcriptional regulator [Bacteroidales bacterium]